MDKIETTKFTDRFADAFPNVPMTVDVIEGWAIALEPYTLEEAIGALRQYIATDVNGYKPTPPRITGLIDAMRDKAKKIRRAVDMVTYYSPKEFCIKYCDMDHKDYGRLQQNRTFICRLDGSERRFNIVESEKYPTADFIACPFGRYEYLAPADIVAIWLRTGKLSYSDLKYPDYFAESVMQEPSEDMPF